MSPFCIGAFVTFAIVIAFGVVICLIQMAE